MVSFLDRSSSHSVSPLTSLESCIRKSLAFGKLSSSTEAQINALVLEGQLSSRDYTLLAILRDALQDGAVRRVADG